MDAAIVHLDSDLLFGAYAGHIYLIGNNSVNIQDFNIAANTWAQLAGGGGARAGAPAVGATLTWNLHNPGVLFSHRGGNAATLDTYDIASDTWTSGVAYIPVGTLLWNTGSDACECWPMLPICRVVNYAANAGTLYQLANGLTNPIYTQSCRIYGTDGVAHVGKSMVAYQYAGIRYIVYRLHGSTQVQRIRLVD